MSDSLCADRADVDTAHTCHSRWRKRLKQDAHALPKAEEVIRARRWVLREAHALVLLPIFAVLMARGLGL